MKLRACEDAILCVYFVCTYVCTVAPATEIDPIDTQAALEAFDEYYDLTRDYVEVEMFTSKCVGYGVIPETSPITGASLFLPDHLKMDIVLPLIRNNIALNGKSIFHLMTRVLDSMGDYRQLASGFESTYAYINYVDSYNYKSC